MKILLPTDGSRYALAAAKAVATWFPRPGTSVDLLSVVPSRRHSSHRSYAPPRAPEQEWRAAAGRWLDATAEPLASHGYRLERIVRKGNPAEVVARQAADGAYDLVVVGAKGQGDTPFFGIGSVALQVLEHAPSSILMVREPKAKGNRPPSALHPFRVIVATDGDAEAERALRRIQDLLGVEHVQVRTLAVADEPVGGPLGEREAWVVARRGASMLTDHGVPAEPWVAAGEPSDRILDAAHDADLVVLGSRSVLRPQELHLGSVALQVARAVPCSLLLVREGTSAGAPVEEARDEGPSIPFEVAYRNVEPSEAVERQVLRGLARLGKLEPEIIRCHVMLELRHPRHRKGNLFHVRVDLTVPGREVTVSRTPPKHRESEEPVTAIGEAFDKVRQRLAETLRVQRGDVKTHEVPPHGVVTDLFPDHGFIRAADGRVIYFHRNSVLNDAYDNVAEGAEVRFAESMGDQGPQATSVTLIGKHHLHQT